MKISRKDFIQELRNYLLQHQEQIKAFMQLSDESLQLRPSNGGWTILECVEHLNQYGRYYIPEMNAAIDRYRVSESEYFTPGWIGNYFAQSMLPTSNRKMKAMKAYNPKGKLLGREVLEELLHQQGELKKILDKCEHSNVTAIKCSISLTSFLKLRLGDTLRVVVYHNERHLQQAKRVVG